MSAALAYSVTDLAKLTGINASAIRYYIKIGLLSPSRQVGTQYMFAPSQLDRLRAVLAAKTAGRSLEEIKADPGLVHNELPLDEVKLCKVIALVNQKGGVGKSTTAVNLAYSLCQLGQRILLIDNDPQANATKGLGYFQPVARSIYDILKGDVPLSEVRIRTEYERLDLVPANLSLADAEMELVTETAREFKLFRALKDYHDEYDFVLIDCNPSLGILTINALVAATDTIIPIDSGPWALEGIVRLTKVMEKVIQAQVNPDLRLLGVLMTKYDHRTTIARRVIQDTSKAFGPKLFRTKIPVNTKVQESQGEGLPVHLYDKSATGARAYMSLAHELLGGEPDAEFTFEHSTEESAG